MSATINLSPGMVTPSLVLIHTSALVGCTTVVADEYVGHIERNWPTLSTGEELLWSLLSWLNGVGEMPSVVSLTAGLDSMNLLAAMDAVDAGRGVRA